MSILQRLITKLVARLMLGRELTPEELEAGMVMLEALGAEQEFRAAELTGVSPMHTTCKHDGFSHTRNLSCPTDPPEPVAQLIKSEGLWPDEDDNG